MSKKVELSHQDETRGNEVRERSDGLYWEDAASRQTFGPFATLEEALADMQGGSEADLEVGETVEEAEAELGIADWIDRDTGLPAEDGVPRLEDDKPTARPDFAPPMLAVLLVRLRLSWQLRGRTRAARDDFFHKL